MSIFTSAITWLKTEVLKIENSNFFTTAKSEIDLLWNEFEPLATSDLEKAVEITATASLGALATGGTGAAITAGIAAATTAFEQAGHTISSQAINLLATTVVNTLPANPAANSGAAAGAA